MKKLFGNLLAGSNVSNIEVLLQGDGTDERRTATIKGKHGETETLPLFSRYDNVAGEVQITPQPGKKLEHQGIKIQLLGQIIITSERGAHHDFLSLIRELAPPGELTDQTSFKFEFNNVDLQHESYRGSQVRCVYFLRVTLARNLSPLQHEAPIWVRNYSEKEHTAPIKMEVGIEDCLHIEFEYNSSCYHLKDCVEGQIYFLLVRIKLKHMEVEIRRRETLGQGTQARNETETLHKIEIMDGAPVRGETVPIRLYLSPFDLTPTYTNVQNKFSVKYFLNLVLVDEEDRRYFKQQEIQLSRKPGT